ncbi:hypothetical protein G6F56_010977 [Rhizopus delemar]|uniref:arginine--tRNA ligase n=1 Tax=Rhizopus stolonifer TaxID=4846 RepID=A0A367J6B8_RHIST|nr:hypothetical protein G6F56_010977 [Rhizopus delemar]RCH85502.1 hypothetical protein CU098_003107 [Rhizopus stolonifer]
MEHNPIEHLDDIYTKISQDMKHDPEKITKQISAYLKKLDEGDTEAVQQWEKLWIHRRQLHKEDYKRLGVRFDFILNELETERYIPRVYQLLEEKDLCELSEDGSLVMYLSRYDPNLGKPVVRKADGTSTHLTKDIANILMCHEKYGDVEKMIYVADIDQERYFKQLFRIVNLMLENTSPCSELIHVAFGKILNMSVIPLKQVLDTAKEKTLKVIKEDMKHGKYVDILKEGISVNGRNIQGEEAVDYIADTLGISAILTQDMAVKRTRQYRFLWDKMTDARGDTGIFLQYTHARICGIERKLDMPVSAHCHFSLLNEPEAFELVYAISLYPDIIQTAFQTLDSCTVVTYLFKLAHMISQANYNLRIKDVNPNLAEARLLLFWAAKTTLANGMRLIGLCPLERM